MRRARVINCASICPSFCKAASSDSASASHLEAFFPDARACSKALKRRGRCAETAFGFASFCAESFERASFWEGSSSTTRIRHMGLRDANLSHEWLSDSPVIIWAHHAFAQRSLQGYL